MIAVEELERRMRPGAWSVGGLLGDNERLEKVLAADARTLVELGLTTRRDRRTLALLIAAPVAVATEVGVDFSRLRGDPGWGARERLLKEGRALIEERFGAVEGVRWGMALVGSRYEVETTTCMGFQECPWSADRRVGDLCDRNTTDWRIRDTTRGLEMGGPGLITHLITEHGFFEGFDSPSRVDPRALAELLQLGPFVAG